MNSLSSKDRLEANEAAARANRQAFDAAGVTAITVVGPAGSGKTTLIESLLLRLAPPMKCALVLASRAADRQIARITRHGYPAVAISTDNISAVQVQEAVKGLDLREIDLLFIEADGSAIDLQGSDLGQHFRVGVFSAVGGDDKVNEFPSLVAGADLVVLTKVDLLPFVKFNLKDFAGDIERIKRSLPLAALSVQSGEGMDRAVEWMRSQVAARRASGEGGSGRVLMKCSTKR
jgi:hydrogenase nickel incorporation protein HypB